MDRLTNVIISPGTRCTAFFIWTFYFDGRKVTSSRFIYASLVSGIVISFTTTVFTATTTIAIPVYTTTSPGVTSATTAFSNFAIEVGHSYISLGDGILSVTAIASGPEPISGALSVGPATGPPSSESYTLTVEPTFVTFEAFT